MTITEEKHKQILGEGFDGLLFMGMGGPEVALLTDVAQLKQELSPIPKGIQALVDKRGSLPEKAVSDYNIKLPEGYVLENGRFVYKSTQVDSNAMSGTQADDYQYSVAA